MKTAARTKKSELRKHYFLDRYVVIAPKRALRPGDLGTQNSSHTTETPTSPALEKSRSVFQINDGRGNWMVKVINNDFPALTLDNPKAYGKQEVIIETPVHNFEFSALPLAQIRRIFLAYRQRSAALKQLPGIRHVSVFKNDGARAGASISHAHSQIYALPIVPPHLAHEAAAMATYEETHNACAYCDVLAWELKTAARVVFRSRHLLAFAPYASENPFEVWLVPRRHVSNFIDLTDDEEHDLAQTLKKVTMFLDKHRLSFNFFLQDSLPEYRHHFIVKVEPRQSTLGGLELSTGIIINPMPPEQAADWIRQSL